MSFSKIVFWEVYHIRHERHNDAARAYLQPHLWSCISKKVLLDSSELYNEPVLFQCSLMIHEPNFWLIDSSAPWCHFRHIEVLDIFPPITASVKRLLLLKNNFQHWKMFQSSGVLFMSLRVIKLSTTRLVIWSLVPPALSLMSSSFLWSATPLHRGH